MAGPGDPSVEAFGGPGYQSPVSSSLMVAPQKVTGVPVTNNKGTPGIETNKRQRLGGLGEENRAPRLPLW